MLRVLYVSSLLLLATSASYLSLRTIKLRSGLLGVVVHATVYM